MGRTHGVHAEPMTFGLKLALWWDELRRQRERMAAARDSIRVGKISGAVGTHATIPPHIEERVCHHLGLDVAPVSNQVVQRDRHAHFITTAALVAASLEKFATEIRGMQRTEIHEVEEPFGAGQTGSSSMPHKRNPELTERICGLARTIRGNAVPALENVALWGERDISHSSSERIILPDTCLMLDYILSIFTHVVSGWRVDADRMWQNLESSRGLIFSQRVLLALVEDKGLSRETAYDIVQRNAMRAWGRRPGLPAVAEVGCRGGPAPERGRRWTNSSTTATTRDTSTTTSSASGCCPYPRWPETHVATGAIRSLNGCHDY